MKKIIVLIIVFQLFSCQKSNTKKLSKSNNRNMETPECLQQQLRAGYSAEVSETDYPNYNYSESDLDCSIPILEKELKNSGYKFLDHEEFTNKVLQIFGRKLDYSKSTKYAYIDGDRPCNKELFYHRNSDDEFISKSYYIVKNKSFITELFAIPELIDYQKEYPKINDFEENLPLKYKDDEGDEITIIKWSQQDLSQMRNQNIEKFVNRNLFLFNDKNGVLPWLIFNDENFLEILCKNYGFDKNDKLNEHFIKKIIKEQNISKYKDFFFRKDCNNKLIINTNFFNSFSNILNNSKKANEALFLKNLASHLMIDNNFDNYSIEDKIKTICHLANVYDPLFKNYHNEDVNWGNMTVLADAKDFYGDKWYNIKSIIIRNNYYNLPNIPAVLEYAEQFDSNRSTRLK